MLYYVELLVINVKILITIPLITSVISIVYVLYFTNPVYESTAKIMSSSSPGKISQSLGLASQFGIDLLPMQNQVEWPYPEIIKSRTLARSILKRKFDSYKYGKEKSLQGILLNESVPENQKIAETLAINNLLNSISVSKSKKGGFYTLRVTTFEAKLAADIAAVIIDELDKNQREKNNAKVRDTRTFIEERILEIGKELNTAEESLKVFRERNRRITNSPSLLLEEERLIREVAVLTGVFTTLKQKLETTKIDEVKDSDYVIVLDPPEVPLERSAPNRSQIVILSGFSGISLALFLIFLVESGKNKFVKNKTKIRKIKKIFFKNIINLILLKKH